MLTQCFICTSHLPNPSSSPRSFSKKKRGRLKQTKEELNFNCDSEIVNDLKLGLLPRSYKTLLKHLLTANYDSSGAKNDIYKGIVNSIACGGSLLKFCGNCDKLARDVVNLELELEVIQMRLVEKVRLARETVVRSYFESNHNQALLVGDPVLSKEVELLGVLRKFQCFVAEHDTIGKPIPLIYLGNLKLAERDVSNTLGSGSHCVPVKGESMEETEFGDNDNADYVMDFSIETEDVDFKEQFMTKEVSSEPEEDLVTDDIPLQKASIPEEGRMPRVKTTIKRRSVTAVSVSDKKRTPRKYQRRNLTQNGQSQLRNIYNYFCEICKFETRTPSRMEQHLREHEEEVEKNCRKGHQMFTL